MVILALILSQFKDQVYYGMTSSFITAWRE